ncbi:MAG: PqqD family protein [Candidatus Binataceae bacterium]
MKIRIAEDVVWREVAGEVVILNIVTGIYFGLEGAGSEMWRKLAENGSVDKALEVLEREFDASPADLRRDLEALVQQLTDKNLLELLPDQAA